MKFSFSTIIQNFLYKVPTVVMLLLVILGTVNFNHPKHSQNEVVASDDSSKKWEKGYAGGVPVILELTEDGRIDTVKLGQNSETKGYIKKMTREGLFDRWDGMLLTEIGSAPTEAVSGATFSSRAVIANVRMEAARLSNTELVENDQFTAKWWVMQVALWMVVGLAIVSYLMPAKMKKWRWVLIVATIGVLGFWQGTFLSMQLFYNLIINGSSLLQITLIAILLLSILAPLLFNKMFYCQYLCPFGMLQEAAGKIPVKKMKISPRVTTAFKWTRRVTFCLFVVLLWVNPHFEPGEWEPFSSFIAVRDVVNFGAMSVIIIAGVSVVMSIFMPRAWCRTLCPAGEFFRILQEKPNYKKIYCKK